MELKEYHLFQTILVLESWIDSNNSLWSFGGFGFDSFGNGGKLIEM
jgi:hypothetical protein